MDDAGEGASLLHTDTPKLNTVPALARIPPN
jgi:hypothetical protein